MNKNGWIICSIIFVFVTSFVLSLDNKSSLKRVKFSNSNVKIGHDSTEFVDNSKISIGVENSGITNSKINAKNSDVSVGSSDNFSTSDVSFNNSGIDYEGTLSDSNFSNSKIEYKNLDDAQLDNALADAKKIDEERKSPPKRQARYMYKDVDWSIWKSDFVNRILDDSLLIHELDKYNEGDWFKYSFDVDNNGKITNIKVFSFVLSEKDKNKVIDLIKSYQYEDITVFPANTTRKYAEVSAIVVLSNTTQKSNPSDFKDTERIKIKLNN